MYSNILNLITCFILIVCFRSVIILERFIIARFLFYFKLGDFLGRNSFKVDDKLEPGSVGKQVYWHNFSRQKWVSPRRLRLRPTEVNEIFHCSLSITGYVDELLYVKII